VYLLGRRLEALEKAASQLDPKIVSAIQCDVTNVDSLTAAAKQVEQEVGYIDVLINNVRIYRGCPPDALHPAS